MADEGYISDPIESDEGTMQDEAFDFMQANWPDWIPNDSNLETWQTLALGRMLAEAKDTAKEVPPDIFKYFGQTLLGIPAVAATYAEVASTWTFKTNPAGRTVVDGTLVSIPGDDEELVAFEVIGDVVVASPTLTTPVGAVLLRAVDPGEDADGLGGDGQVVNPIDSISWIDTVTLEGATDGGSDEETGEEYRDRLSDRLTLLTPRPILAKDYALLARDLATQNGADVRAVAIDNYNPADGTYTNERMVAVAMANDDGTAASAPTKTFVGAGLQAQRELNFVVNMIDPTFNTVNVNYRIKVKEGYSVPDTVAAVNAALTDHFHPSAFGRPDPDSHLWIRATAVWRQDASLVIRAVDGVEYWDILELSIGAGALAAAESYALTGAAPLTQIGAITSATI